MSRSRGEDARRQGRRRLGQRDRRAHRQNDGKFAQLAVHLDLPRQVCGHISTTVFSFASPAAKSRPIMSSMSMKVPINLVMKVLGPYIAQVTIV